MNKTDPRLEAKDNETLDLISEKIEKILVDANVSNYIFSFSLKKDKKGSIASFISHAKKEFTMEVMKKLFVAFKL